MPARTCKRRTIGQIAGRALPATLIGAVAGIMLAGCATSGPSSPAGLPTTTQPSFSLTLPAPHSVRPPARTPSTATAVAATTTPQAAAVQWLIAYHSLTWSAGSPAAWITQVKPYVTARLNTADQQDAGEGGGIDWSDFVAKQCTSTVADVGAVIPPEAPGTATAVNVQVTGTVATRCAAGSPDTPTESVSATLIVVAGPHGTWLVNQRLF